MGTLSLAHWLIVAVVVLLVFGPTRLSSVGKGLGEGIRNFRKGLEENNEAPAKELPEDERKKA